MKFICTAFEPVQAGQTVVFIGNHTDDHAAYTVRLAGPEDYKSCWGVSLESAEPKQAFHVEADYDNVRVWIMTQLDKERD